MSLSLATDGKDCHGLLTYLSSNEKINLKGSFDNDQFSLNEFDVNDNLIATIKGTIDGDEIEADWMRNDEKRGAKINLVHVKREVKVPEDCSEKKWIRSYHGFINKNEIKVILHHPDDGTIFGIAYMAGNVMDVKGVFQGEEDVILSFKDEFNISFGKLKGTIDEHKTIVSEFHNVEGFATKINLDLVKELKMTCQEYADYHSTYDISYPLTLHPAFNNWMETFTEEWIILNKRDIDKLTNKIKNKSINNRAAYKSYAWCEVAMLNERILSGFISGQSSWSYIEQGVAFNFDLYNNKVLDAKDIFIKDFKDNEFVKAQLDKKLANNILYKDNDFKQWLSNEEFKHFIVQPDGICFSTDFNPIYGAQKVTISYDLLKPYIVENSPIQHLVN